MPELPMLNAGGLVTNSNRTTATPSGAMSQADNVTNSRTGLLVPREAYESYLGYDVLGQLEGFIETMAVFGRASPSGTARILMNRKYTSGPTSYQRLCSPGGGGSDIAVGEYDAPTGERMEMASGASTMYMTTSAGVRRIPTAIVNDDDNWAAGMRRALGAHDRLAFFSSTAYDWFPTGQSAGYRVVIGRTDADGKTMLSEPSPRIIMTNSGPNATPSLTIPLTRDLDTSHFIQLYRTELVASSADPGDDMGLVYERALTAAEITNDHYCIVQDLAPDIARGVPLYTNSLQEGALSANARPPFAYHIASHGDRMLYMRTVGPHRITSTAIANLAVGDVVTVGGVSLTGIATGGTWSMGSGFEVFTAGTVSQNIENTLRSLVSNYNYKALNIPSSDPDPVCLAYYLSGEDDAPGIVMFEAYSPAGASFTAAVSTAPERFAPRWPLSSEAEDRPGRVYWSKPGQYDSVPLLNYRDLGSVDAKVLGSVASRDSFFVFKEDGIWRGTDTGAGMRFDKFDTTARIVGAQTAQPLGNNAFALTNQGVVEVSDSGVSVVSLDIENYIRELLELPANASPFAVTSESTRTYRLFLLDPDVEGPSGQARANVALVYCMTTGLWTRHVLGAGSACSDPLSNDTFVAADADSNVFLLTNGDTDSVTVSVLGTFDGGVDGWAFQVENGGGVVAGMEIEFSGGGDTYHVTSTYKTDNTDPFLIFVEEDLTGVTPDEGDLYICTAPIVSTMKWAKTDAGDPTSVKHWQEMLVAFQEPRSSSDTNEQFMTFKADLAIATAAVEMEVNAAAPSVLRCLVPKNHRRSTLIEVGLELNRMTPLIGIKMVLTNYGNRSQR